MSPRVLIAVLASVAGIMVATAPADACCGGPVIVIPGKRGVPVIMNGLDVSGAVVYRDWGLKRPGADPIIEGGVPVYPGAWVGAFYPATGRAPAYGRKEVEPPPGRKLPEPAPTYYRNWSAGSAPGPVTEYPPLDMPHIDTPRQRPGR